MKNVSRRHGLLALSALFTLLAIIGCFQSASSGIQATPIGGTGDTGVTGVPISTPVPADPLSITNTPFPPVIQPATMTPAVLQDPLAMTATQIIIDATQAAGGFVVTATPVPPFASDTSSDSGTEGGEAVAGDCTHVVQPGENLFRIAMRYGLTTSQMAQANNIANPALIHVGQVLNVPNCTPGSGAAPVAPSTGTGGATYIVQPGDNLFRIALRYNVTVEQIMAASGLTNRTLIYPGQQLTIP